MVRQFVKTSLKVRLAQQFLNELLYMRCDVRPAGLLTKYLRERGEIYLDTNTEQLELNNFASVARRICPESEEPARRYHIYTDGSYYAKSPGTTSWAVVVVKQSRVGFHFCGSKAHALVSLAPR